MKLLAGHGSLSRRFPVGVAAVSLIVLFALCRVDFEATRISPVVKTAAEPPPLVEEDRDLGEKAAPTLVIESVEEFDVESFEEVGDRLGEKALPAPDADLGQTAAPFLVEESVLEPVGDSVPPALVEEFDEESVEEVGGRLGEKAAPALVEDLGQKAALTLVVDGGSGVTVAPALVEEVGDRPGEKAAPALVEEAALADEESDDWDPGWGVRLPVDEAGLLAQEEALQDADPVEESPTGPIKWRYDVCLVVKLGRRGNSVPFAELPRLFNATKGAPNGSAPWNTLSERRVLVGADFADILCLMVRDDLGPQVECTNYNRFGVKTNQCKHLVLGATKKYTPQPSPDELKRYSFVWSSVETVNLDSADPARQPPPLPMSQWRPTIVTGFSSKHLEVGLLLLRSVGKASLEKTQYNVSVVVWTMGEFPPLARRALACVVNETEALYGVPTEVRRFDFDAWPSWMRVNQKSGAAGEYAWKAVMIHTVLLERGFVFWADAGDRFRTASALTTTLAHVKRKGFASRHAGGIVRDTTHVNQLQYFAANRREITSMPNCDTSSVGFTLRRYTELARPWFECCITRQCIAPDGSSRENHRQDQSALTIVAALARDSCEGVDFFMDKKMDALLNSHTIGTNATDCYVDPLNFKWQ